MVPDNSPIIADTDKIRADLEYMTRRWGELDTATVFELRAFGENKQTQTAKFASDWIDEAVDWAERMNALGFNIYSTRNPIRHDAKGSAKDEDVLAAFFIWADCDEPAAAQNVHRFDGPQWSAAVTTGKTPSTRVHIYWELDEPCTDMAAWRDMQRAIAAHFGSDGKVINPSRIMRLGGTVSYPDRKKQAKGYVKELATIRTEYPDIRKPVTMEQMRRVFGASASQGATTSPLAIDTGPQPLDRERARIQALSGQEWHDSVIRLVGSYVSRGLGDDEIHALTDPLTLQGYTVEETRREVQTAIDGARRKGWTPEPDFTPNFDHAPAPTTSDPTPASRTWAVQSASAFTSDFVAPEYLIEGVVQRGRLYTLTAPTGSGKTAVMLYAATAIATEMDFCGLEVEHGDVLFLAGENPDDVRARVIATMDFYGIDPSTCRLHFVAGTFSIRADMKRLREEAEKLQNLVLIVVDTFAAYFDGDEENSNAQTLDFARVVRNLTAISSKPAVIMPAHPVKNAGKQNLAPKGGSSLVNEVDGNLTLWNSEGILDFHWQVKHRGPDFEPIRLELVKSECGKIRDKKGRIMPTILAKPLLQTRALQIIRDTLSTEDRLLLNIEAFPAMSMADRCIEVGLINGKREPKKSSLAKMFQRLSEQKLVKRFRTNWELTDGGKKAVAMIRNGGEFADDEL